MTHSLPVSTMALPFPDELLLHIFSYLQLKGLVRAIGVSKTWRSIILDDALPSARSALLKAYMQIVQEPNFLRTRARNLIGLAPFNRQAYLDDLLDKYQEWLRDVRGVEDPQPIIPGVYMTYILEWPERAIVGRIWPGFKYSLDYFDQCLLQRPHISFVELRDGEKGLIKIPLLPIMGHGLARSDTLLLEGGGGIAGCVLGVGPVYSQLPDNFGGESRKQIAPKSWAEYLMRESLE